jgi:hypothetical protein
MKRPLIATTRSNVLSLEAKDKQTRLEEDKQVGKGLVWQALLLRSAVGFLLEVMVLATCNTVFKIWVQNPTFSGPLSLVSYLTLVLLSQSRVICLHWHFVCLFLFPFQVRICLRA